MISYYKYSDKEIKDILQSIVVVVDSREQKNKHILDVFDKHKIKYITKKLDEGDYTFYVPQNTEYGFLRDLWFDRLLIFERKASLEELSGNFSKDRSRLEKEFATMKAQNKILIIENSQYGDIVSGNYNTQYSIKSYLATLHTFASRYNLDIMFMPTPEHTALYMLYSMRYCLREVLK